LKSPLLPETTIESGLVLACNGEILRERKHTEKLFKRSLNKCSNICSTQTRTTVLQCLYLHTSFFESAAKMQICRWIGCEFDEFCAAPCAIDRKNYGRLQQRRTPLCRCCRRYNACCLHLESCLYLSTTIRREGTPKQRQLLLLPPQKTYATAAVSGTRNMIPRNIAPYNPAPAPPSPNSTAIRCHPVPREFPS
jgi:hypothetical protein